jgi:hypothetical protein
LDRGFGYGTVFTIAGMLHVAAFLIILAAIPTMQPLRFEGKLLYREAQ